MIQIAIPGRQGGRTTRDRTRGRWRKAWSRRPARRRHWSFNDNEHHAIHLRPASPAASATAPGLCSRPVPTRAEPAWVQGPGAQAPLRLVAGDEKGSWISSPYPPREAITRGTRRRGALRARRTWLGASQEDIRPRTRLSIVAVASRRVASSSGFRLRHVGGRAGGTWRVSPRRDPSARAITNPSCPGAWRRRSGAHRRPRRRPAPRGRSG